MRIKGLRSQILNKLFDTKDKLTPLYHSFLRLSKQEDINYKLALMSNLNKLLIE